MFSLRLSTGFAKSRCIDIFIQIRFMPTLLEKYINGEYEEVYDEIYSLEQDAFLPENFTQIDLVLKETFRRVAYNLDIIYKELKNINYQFVPANIADDWQTPVLPPAADTESLLAQLKSKVEPLNYIPFSLQYFYKIVGSCTFCWDYDAKPEIPWEGADPLDIPPLKYLLDNINEGFINDDIMITGDYLHKDNVSGDTYTLELPKSQTVDSLFSYYDIFFIEYLRLTFRNCGFTMADECDYQSLKAFCDVVRPQLLEI